MGSEGSKEASSHGKEEEGDDHDRGTASRQNPITPLNHAIRQRLRHGVNYNLKIILKGRKGSGKTTLWKRLQGMKFYPQYEETCEIQVATIDWNYKMSHEDIVKVEVWDIVDQGIRKNSPDLCAKEIEVNGSKPLLDAQNIDVYRGTHAVVFMICPFSIESLDYARKEVHQVPSNVAIIFLLGFRDLIEPDQYSEFYLPPSQPSQPTAKLVALRDVYQLVNEIRQRRKEPLIGSEEPSMTSNTVYAAEVSLVNCWGLIDLDRFFSIPFLLLKKQSLLEQLNRTEMELTKASSVLYQDEVTWSQEGQPVGVIEKYQSFSEKYGGRSKVSNPSVAPTIDHAQIVPSESNSHTNTTGIHSELKEIMNSESEVPRSIPPDSTSKSLQLVHASHNSTPNPSSSSSPASIQESQASSTLEKSQANEGDLDQFIPPVDHSNSQELDNFFDDVGEVKVISPVRRQDRIVDEGDGSSSSPTALTPTGTTKSLVRIKKKKFDP